MGVKMCGSKTQIIKWREVEKAFATSNPALTDSINKIPGAADFNLIKVQYPYMSAMLEKGEFYLNINDKLIPYRDDSVDPKLKKLLNYPWKTTPPGIVTQNTLEALTQTFSHTIPFGLIKPGALYSTLSIFNSETPGHSLKSAYSLSSGCQSILLLPQLSDTEKNDCLRKKYVLTEAHYPKNFSEQTRLLKAITSSPCFDSQWAAETLFFTKDFFEHTNREFMNELTKRAWSATAFHRTSYLYEILWKSFLEKVIMNTVGSMYKRSSEHITAVVQNLVSITIGTSPGFIPAIDDSTAPVSAIIDMYLDVYKSRFFHPTIMTIDNFNGNLPVYYSLHRHTFFNPAPEFGYPAETVKELALIRDILLKFQDAVVTNSKQLEFDLEDTIMRDTLSKTKFDFYHPQAKGHEGIKSNIEEIFEEDSRFFEVHRAKSEYGSKLKPPTTSLFFKGCVKISNNIGECNAFKNQ